MIDERTLADPTRCPSCGSMLAGPRPCQACGVSLTGPTAQTLWRVSLEAARLLGERRLLVERLRTEARPEPVRGTAAIAAAPGADVPRPPSPPAPRPEWSRQRVQQLLLGLGVLLLAVAAVIFLVVSWGSLGVGGRAAVMVGCTALAAAASAVVHRRGLESTAEAVGLLTVGLALLDALGARSAGLFGLDAAAGTAYWAGALAILAALAGLGAAVLPLRSFRLAAAVTGQLPVPLLGLYLADGASHPAALLAAALAVQTIASTAAAVGWPAGRATDAWRTVAAGAAIAWTGAVGVAAAAAYGEEGSLLLGTLLLVLLAGVAGAAAWAAAGRAVVEASAVTAAAVAGLLGAWAPLVDAVEHPWLPAALSAAAGLLLAATLAVPAERRLPAVLVTLAAAVAPGLAAAEAVVRALAGPLTWLDRPWTADAGSPARDLVGVGVAWSSGLEVPALLVAVAAALGLAACSAAGLRAGSVAVVPVLALAALTAPLALDLGYAAALTSDLAVAGLLLAAGPLAAASLAARGWPPAVGWAAGAAGATVLGVASVWALAAETATLTVLPLVAGILLLASVPVRPATIPQATRLALRTAAAAAVVAEAAALARHAGAGWPAVWCLTLTLGAALAVAGSAITSGGWLRGLAVTAAALASADAGAVAWWAGGSVADAGLAVAVAAAVLLVAATWSPRPDDELRDDLWATAAVGVAAGVSLSATDPDRLWLSLLAAGVAVGTVAVHPRRRRLGWLAGLLLTASSWVRLALSDVDAPEAYTVPAGVALVAAGALRRRHDPAYRSWPAYAPGLALALVPSLLRAVDDVGTARPLLLGLAALAVLATGVVRRLQAPLVVGGGVLAVDALAQLSPHLADLYAVVPRWVSIGAVGLALLVVGATYEHRVRELRRLRQSITQMG